MLNETKSNTETATQNQENKRDMDTVNFDQIAANLHIVQEQVKELEHALSLARGTGDHTEKAEQAAKEQAPLKEKRPVGRPPKVKDPRSLIEKVLHGQSLNVAGIAKATGMQTAKITEAVKTLKHDKKIANVGSEDFPKWTYRIGDHTETQVLINEIKRLISERPMSTQELLDVTGARLTRVSGALVHLQRTETQLLNLGTQRRARWFLVGEGVTLAKLPPKGVAQPS